MFVTFYEIEVENIVGQAVIECMIDKYCSIIKQKLKIRAAALIWSGQTI